MPIYITNNKTYMIPADKAMGFEERHPESKQAFLRGGKRYDIPLDERTSDGSITPMEPTKDQWLALSDKLGGIRPKAYEQKPAPSVATTDNLIRIPNAPIQSYHTDSDPLSGKIDNAPEAPEPPAYTTDQDPFVGREAKQRADAVAAENARRKSEQAFYGDELSEDQPPINGAPMPELASVDVESFPTTKESAVRDESHTPTFTEYAERIIPRDWHYGDKAPLGVSEMENSGYQKEKTRQDETSPVRLSLDDQMAYSMNSLNEEINALTTDSKRRARLEDAMSKEAKVQLYGSKNASEVLDYAKKEKDRYYKENQELLLAREINSRTEDLIDQYKRYKQGDKSSFFHGVIDQGKSINNWDFGMSDLADSVVMKRVADKVELGQELTQSERLLMDSIANNAATNGYYADKIGIAYNAGKTLGANATYMAEFMVNPLSGLGAGLAKKVSRYAIRQGTKRLGTSVAKQGTGMVARKVTAQAITGAARLAGNAVGAAGMALTTGLPSVIADTERRREGVAGSTLDENGVTRFDGTFSGAEKNGLKAFGKSSLAKTEDNFGEMFGYFLAKGGGALARGADRIIDKASGVAKRIARIPEAAKTANWLDKAEAFMDGVSHSGLVKEVGRVWEKGQWNGVLGEYSEEVFTNILNCMTVGDQTWDDVFDKDQNLETFLGVAAMSAFSVGTQSVGYGIDRIHLRNALHDADRSAAGSFGDNWGMIKTSLDESLSSTDHTAAARQIRSIMQSEGYTPEQKSDLSHYFTSALMDRSLTEGTNAVAKSNPFWAEDQKLQQSVDEGIEAYDNSTEEAGKIATAVESLRNNMSEERREALDGITGHDAALYMHDHPEDTEAAEYFHAQARLQGVVHGIDHASEQETHVLGLETAARTNKEDGTIHKVSYGQGETAYVVQGTIASDEEGNIDHSHSSERVVVRTESGEVRMIPATDIHGAIETIDPEELMHRGSEQIYSEKIAEMDALIMDTTEPDTSEETGQEEIPQTALSYRVGSTIRTPQGDGVIYQITPDGKMSVEFEEHVSFDGSTPKTVHTLTAEEAQALEGQQGKENISNEQEVEAVQQGAEQQSALMPQYQNELDSTHEGSVENEIQASAMDRIPKDGEGNPLYDKAETPDLAWDSIVEQADGDESMAQTVVDGMVTDKEAALKKIEKTKSKGGETIAEKIASEKERNANIEEAYAQLDIWKRIANTAHLRKMEKQSERNRIASEKAAELKAEQDKLRAEKEEAERIEREPLNGVPDMVYDTPQNARARGYRRVNGHKVDRQQPLQSLQGKEVSVKFGNDALSKGRVVVIDATELQPSHLQGVRNPAHFIDEAQPKERNDEASVLSARKIASNVRPEEITSSVTAYTGAPTVNARGEVIQGNNRSDALRYMWDTEKEQADKYKHYIKDHASEFGLNAKEVDGIKRPVIVNMIDVTDDEAIKLGQYVAQDTESGGVERIKPKNALQKMGAGIKSFSNMLLASSDDETSFAGLVDNNGAEVLKWMNQRGYITPTQYNSAFDSKGNISAEAKNDLKGILYKSIFNGGSTRLEEMFNHMPAKAQKAILATAYRDIDSPVTERMIEEIQSSIRAFYILSHIDTFAEAKNFKDSCLAIESWKRQYQMDDATGESYLPSDKFSNFALHIAAMYKGDSQKYIQKTFNTLYDLIQGTTEETLFNKPDNQPLTLVEAIYKELKIVYHGQIRSTVLGSNTTPSKSRERGGGRATASRERTEIGSESADRTGGTESGSGQSEIAPNNDENAKQGAETTVERNNDEQRKADSGRVADDTATSVEGNRNRGDIRVFEKGLGTSHNEHSEYSERNRREAESERLVAIAKQSGQFITSDETKQFGRKFGKRTGESEVYINEEQGKVYKVKDPYAKAALKNGVQPEDAIYEHTIHNLLFPETEYTFEGISEDLGDARIVLSQNYIQSAGQPTTEQITEALAAKGLFPEDNYSFGNDLVSVTDMEGDNVLLGEDGTVYFIDPIIKFKRPAKEIIESLSNTNQESIGKKVEAAEAETNTAPSDAQKEAGNYKKGHVQVGTFDLTIENPKGSERSGTDAKGNKWSITMQNTYGYIRGTEGVDGDHIDVFLSDDIDGWNGRKVFVIDQTNTDGSFDEHKVMLGFNNSEDASEAYFSNYESNWSDTHPNINMSEVNIEDFEKWIASSHRKTKSFAEYKNVKSAETSTVSKKETVAADGYTVEPAKYTTKRGKILDMQLVKFGRELTKEEQRGARELVKNLKGWYDREQGGFMMRSAEDAQQIVDAIMEESGETLADAAPISLQEIQKAERIAKEQEAKAKNEGALGLVSDERMAELKERLHKKLGGQLNVGIDPEILAIGMELAAGHIDRGVKKFADFAKVMVDDFGDVIRPYLKAFYNGARDLPEIMDNGLSAELTPYDDVRRFDVANFDKEQSNPFATAETVVAEQAVQQQAEEAKKGLVEKRNTERKSSKEKTVSSQAEPTDLFGGLFDTNINNEEYENGQRTRRENRQGDDGVSQGKPIGRRTTVSERLDSDLPKSRDEQRGNSNISEQGSNGELNAQRPAGRIPGLKNTNNNHSERGENHAPNSVDARIEANIKAIELAQQLLESGEKATTEQMSVLRKFSGWGGLGKAFNESNIKGRLQELLGSEAYSQAVMSANSAYYTPAYVVDTLWDVAEQMGFKGGNILEGSAGIGNVLGQMPTNVSENSNIQAIEIDGTSGGILSLLYPDAKVDIQGFEQTRIPNGSVDLAITNVPFVTGLRVNDTTGDSDLSKKFHNIHDFCIAKNIRKLREGGIGIFITSNGTLDNSKKLRDWITNEGCSDFVGAFRMNNKTFGGTGVTSDIIVIRKRVNARKSANAIDVSDISGERSAEYDTGETRKIKGQEVPVTKQLSMDYNKYFIEHPENMAGEMHFAFEQGDTFRPTSKGLYPTKEKNQEQMLANFVKSFKEEEFSDKGSNTDTDVAEVMPDKKIGELFERDGKLYVNSTASSQLLSVNDNKVKGHTKVECFNAYTAIKQALNNVLSYQTENDSDNGLKPLLAKLNKAYDDFVNTYGHFNKNTSISFLRNDVDYPNVFSLEKYEETGDKSGNRVQSFGKTDVFKQRVVEKEKEPTPTNVKDGIVASMFKFGRIDIPYITEQIGESQQVVKSKIISDKLGFEDPTTKQMELSFRYLSGNVREKLRQAQENNETGEYDENIKALQDVIPMDIPAHLIDFTLGSSWIDPKLYNDYVKERTDIEVGFTAAGGTWFMSAPDYGLNKEKNRSMGVISEKFDKQIMGHTLIEAAIQNKSITVSETKKKWDGTTETITDKEATQACAAKIDEIRQDFKEFARQRMQSDSDMSAKMERIYNDTFNNYVPLSIPDEYVPEYFGGASHKFKMRSHQSKAIVRGTMQPLLLAHEVGTGKTFTLISTAMEMRRLGTARKPMIVVQNATVGQFVASAKELYPNAKILTLEDSDRTAEGRKNFYAKIRYNDLDMIVVPQSTFEFIPDSEERQMAFVQDKIEEKMIVLEKMKEADPKGKNIITRQAEKEIADLEVQLAEISNGASKKRTASDQKKEEVTKQNAEVKALEMLDRRTDDVENFDDMGIDALLIDEAHEYKHLGFATAMQRGVKGVDASYSKKSQGVYLKTQAVIEKNNGRNVIFATGTPISNTAAEIWTFMRYLMPADTMKEYGIYYFDDFVRNFGNIQQMMEFTTSGKFKENNRFAGYVNLPELVRIWSGVSDTVLTKEAGGVNDKIPDIEGGKAKDLYLPQTKALRSIMKYVKAQLEDYEKMSGKEKKENSHIPLTMYGIAKAAAIDCRLVDADAEDEPNSKTNEAVRQTLRSLKDTKSYKGTVAIFADNYQNSHSGFNLYDDIRTKLIADGIPADEVVVIKSGMSVKKKLEIFDKVNKGEIRVVMGSTFTLGTGVNIQERLHTVIHLDAPNRPMDYTQRNGRILRQGNLHKSMDKPVRVLRFGVEDSLDVTAYQRLKTKGAIADSIMNGKQMMQNSMVNRVLEEEEDVFGDTVAQLSGSECAMLKNNAEKNVRKYESRKKQWEADQTYIYNAKPKLKGQIATAEYRAGEQRKYLQELKEAFTEGKSKELTVGKQSFATVDDMADFIKEYNKKVLDGIKEMKDNGQNGEQKRELTVSVGGYDFNIKTVMSKEINRNGGQLFSEVHRVMTYSCPELGLTDVPVYKALLRNALEDITENVITGKDFTERAEAAERSVKYNQSELEQLLSREGKPFEYDKELEQSRKQYAEYAELMKKEMAEKEAKYAEMDKTVEASKELDSLEDDDDVLMRDNDTLYRIREGLNPETPIHEYTHLFDNRLRRESPELWSRGKELMRQTSVWNEVLNDPNYRDIRDDEDEVASEVHARLCGANGAEILTQMASDVRKDGILEQARVVNLIDRLKNWLKEAYAWVIGKNPFTGEAWSARDLKRMTLEDFNAITIGELANGMEWDSHGGDVVRFAFSESNEAFKKNVTSAIDNVGNVTSDLSSMSVKVVKVPKHTYVGSGSQAIEQARSQARNELLRTYELPDGSGYYEISGNAIDKYLSKSATGKSANLGVHLSTLMHLPEIINASIDSEQHADYNKGGNGERGVENGLASTDVLIHRLYGAIHIDDNIYRVKTTMKEYGGDLRRGNANTPHSYEVTQIELLGAPSVNTTTNSNADRPLAMTPYNSISGAKLLKGVEKSYDKGKLLLDESPETEADALDGALRIDSSASPLDQAKTIIQIQHGARELARELNTEVRFIPDNAVHKSVKGTYNTRTGEVSICLPHCTDLDDVRKTIFHEVVAHKGLREMMGERFDEFLDDAYNGATPEAQTDIDRAVAEYHLTRREATEEYVARMAERSSFDNAQQSAWERIVEAFRRMIRRIRGLSGITEQDVRTALDRSYHRLKDSDTLLDRAEKYDRWRLLQQGEEGRKELERRDYSHDTASKEYNERVKKRFNKFYEGYVDRMQSFKILQDVVSKGSEIAENEDAYTASILSGSRKQSKEERFKIHFFRPIVESIDTLDKHSLNDVMEYTMAKCGLERNRVMGENRVAYLSDKIAEYSMPIYLDSFFLKFNWEMPVSQKHFC